MVSDTEEKESKQERAVQNEEGRRRWRTTTMTKEENSTKTT